MTMISWLSRDVHHCPLMLLFAVFIMHGQPSYAQDGQNEDSSGCIGCHQNKVTGFATGHQFGARNCVSCHKGNSKANTIESAHQHMIAFPGNGSNANITCAGCHPARVNDVHHSPMYTGTGMVSVTRHVFDETTTPEGDAGLQSLQQSPADSLLRKQCASCHLARDKTAHSLDVTRDRGGGCLACHINQYPENAHPGLTARVEDGRCFGCHSRSGRIALNYAGLAEVTSSTSSDTQKLGRLNDGRLVTHTAADIHQRAGLACIDCHTSRDLMGNPDGSQGKVDISCSDCHHNTQETLSPDQWPADFSNFRSRVPFPYTSQQPFLQTRQYGSPLWHIEIRGQELILYRKLDGKPLRIPRYTQSSHQMQQQHQRLQCDSCHSQWAPQCTGCHLQYEPGLQQWDHLGQKITPGRWIESRWGIGNGPPSLGVTANNQIAPFVPGMIMTLEHPSWASPKFKRLFARLAPHTTGPSRTCASCHRSSLALGLGQGRLYKSGDKWHFTADKNSLHDGLPADAWTSLSTAAVINTTHQGDRSLNESEIKRVLNAEITPATEP